MSEVANAMAKLAGIRKSILSSLNEIIDHRRGVPIAANDFSPESVQHYFSGSAKQFDILQRELPALYGDFEKFPGSPLLPRASSSSGVLMHYSRTQLERLARDIEHVFEIRANSSLEQPAEKVIIIRRRVFITHGRSNDWREVQSYIEKDIKLNTMELAQEVSLGMTIIEKLLAGAEQCDSAVIVMTGDDIDADGQSRARENVMHEVGFFQGKYGRSKVCLLHEEGVSIPTNLAGVVYVPFPKGTISASFHVLSRELKALYKI